MNTSIKRPPAVWLTQILLVIFALLILSVFLINLTTVLTHLDKEFPVVRTVIVYSIMLGIVLLLLSSFWGLVKRRRYGRWLGFSSLVLLWGLIILIQLLRLSGPYKYYEFDNTAEVVGAVTFQILLHGLFLTLILHLGFGRRVGEYFRKETGVI
jgi:vacuolar-type H+-ATPase subunit I/STV1